MPKSKKPRKPYVRPDFRAEAQRQAEDTYAENIKAPEPVHIDKEPPAPAHPHVVHPSSPRAPRRGGRYLVPVAAGAGIIGSGAYLTHRSRRRKAAMAKGLIDPTTGERVSYERVYIDDAVDKAARRMDAVRIAGHELKRGALKAKKEVTLNRAGLVGAGVVGGAMLPRRETKKRYDESAVEHTGSRRGHGHPVSTVRVPGLPVSSASFSRGNPEARPGTRSHANKVTHVHTKVKASRTGKLFALHHKARSRSGSSVGKSAGFAQSAGSGRRLVSI